MKRMDQQWDSGCAVIALAALALPTAVWALIAHLT